MSSNRKQQERDERRRQRRSDRMRSRQQATPPSETVGHVEFTGPMGFMQRHTRAFFVGGIIVMVLSLGSIFFATQVGTTTPDVADSSDNGSEDIASDPSEDNAPPDDGIVRFYETAPELTIATDDTYEAVISLAGGGEVRIELFASEAPTFVNNFVFLARNGFYDGLLFHRVIPGFVAQAGDPTGAGFGSPGYVLEDERNSLRFERGVLSMAKDAAGQVNGSQFFITLGPTPQLNGDFTVFGKVTEGLDLVDSLTPRDPLDQPDEGGEEIVSIEIIERGA